MSLSVFQGGKKEKHKKESFEVFLANEKKEIRTLLYTF